MTSYVHYFKHIEKTEIVFHPCYDYKQSERNVLKSIGNLKCDIF